MDLPPIGREKINFLQIHQIFRRNAGYGQDKFDELVKSSDFLFSVIPAKVGIQSFQIVLDSRFHGSDGILDFLRVRQI